ncbi:MAG: porphobilinogen synthase [Pseudomonadota bacterium]
MVNSGPLGRFPALRLRRPRMNAWSRALFAETRLSPSDLIWAIIVRDGEGVKEPVPSMPGVYRLSPDQAVAAAQEAVALGIPAMALFPYTGAAERSPNGDEALNPDNVMCRAARAIKDAVPEIGLMADVALDPYTDHGQDGLVVDGEIVNDATVDVLAQQAVLEAKAGFDIIAPSDMMDGRVGAIRQSLDKAGFQQAHIMAYAAKYASALYGPYRDAIGSAGVLKGDKRTYQMDPRNTDEALREVGLDLAEGADSVMVKPGIFYLDIIHRVKEAYGAPTFAFQVSGEYAMIKAAAANGWLDGETAMIESLTAFKRAGADGIITYFAADAARGL